MITNCMIGMKVMAMQNCNDLYKYTKRVHKKCPQKVSTKSVHKKGPRKVSTKSGRVAEGERKGAEGERQGKGR